MRPILFALFPLTAATAAMAATSPWPLVAPVGVPIFGADGPRAIPADHALYRRIVVEPIEGMPKRIGTFLVPVTNAKQVNEALKTSLDHANMLAPEGEAAARLFVTLRQFDVPMKIGFSNHATVVIGYELRRIDNDQTIFQRDITTQSTGRGGNASERVKANARLAVQKNIASAIACIDKAAYGQAPEDCAIGQHVGIRGEFRRR